MTNISPKQSRARIQPLSQYLLKRRLTAIAGKVYWLIRWAEYRRLAKRRATHRLVSSKSKLVIEGPPRCGNSSALRVVTQNNPHYRKRVATHIHRPFQLYYAQQYGVPTVVMLREPARSTISHAALLCELEQVQTKDASQQAKLLLICIDEYIMFARSLAKLGIGHVLPFEEYIRSPGKLIDLINSKYGLNLNYDPKLKIQTESAHVFPSKKREELKCNFQLLSNTHQSIKSRLEVATDLYRTLIAISATEL